MPHPPDIVPESATPRRAAGNSFGIVEAVCGFVAGEFVASLALGAYDHFSGANKTQIGTDIIGFLFLWVGFVGAAVVGTRWHAPEAVAKRPPLGAGPPPVGTGSFVEDYGIRLRPWPDIPLGIAVGVGSQFVLVPLLDLILQPFVHNFSTRIGGPANNLLGHVNGVSLAVLTVLVCVGSPLVEEIFFRGLLLRGLLGRLAVLGPLWGPVLSLVLTGLIFGLAHFEALQFLGLAGFGVVLSYLAYRTGRLGSNMVAHIAFNATTVIAYVVTH